MNVNAGTWNLTGKLTLNGSSPSLTVGNADTVLTSAGGTIPATLNSSELVIKTGSATVEKTGTLYLQKVNAKIEAPLQLIQLLFLAAVSLAGGTFDENETDDYAKIRYQAW